MKEGQRVTHNRYGDGVILDVSRPISKEYRPFEDYKGMIKVKFDKPLSFFKDGSYYVFPYSLTRVI